MHSYDTLFAQLIVHDVHVLYALGVRERRLYRLNAPVARNIRDGQGSGRHRDDFKSVLGELI
jgi:hypothetical protein